MMAHRGLIILLGFIFYCGLAQAEETPLAWSQLPEQAQTVLKPFENEWDGLAEERRARLLKGVERWQGLSPDQRSIMDKRFNRWQSMSPGQKSTLRKHFKQFRQLPPGERELLKRKYRHFQTMPSERRQALRDRWKNLSPDERKDFREERMKRMQQRLEQGLPDTHRLPTDRGLNRPHIGDMHNLDTPQVIIRDR